MADTQSLFRFYEKPPLFQLILSLAIITGAGIFIFSGLVIAGAWGFNVELSLLADTSSDLSSKDIGFLRYLLITQGISLFIIPALIILFFLRLEKKELENLWNLPHLIDIILVAVLSFSLFPLTSFAGQLNSTMNLPEWMSGVEEWMMDKEDSIGDMLGMLINADTFGIMILNLIIIAVIPAIGEELIFRGVFQKICYKLFRSGHLAVWVIAFFFSAIHLQFYGFIPRFILGLVFGYLFLWSRSIWFSIIAHFLNNAVPVLASYFQGWENANSVTEEGIWKRIIFLILPLLILLAILSYFRNNYIKGDEVIENIDQERAG